MALELQPMVGNTNNGIFPNDKVMRIKLPTIRFDHFPLEKCVY